MSRAVYLRWATGSTIYAKPSPLSSDPTWVTDIILFSEIGTTGQYTAEISDYHHEAFLQAGAEPLATDNAIWAFPEDEFPGSAIPADLVYGDSGTYLTSLEEMNDLFSAEGVENHTEDLEDNDTVIIRIVAQATERVMMYLRSQFEFNAIKLNPWVREQATYIACHQLSIRRGNPSLYSALFEQAMMELALVRDGLLSIGAPSAARVVVQTPMLDNRGFHPQRFDEETSTTILPGQKHIRPYYGHPYQ